MIAFKERCAEPIVTRLLRYQVAPRYIEGNMSDTVKSGRTGFDHHLNFQCIMGEERLKPVRDVLDGLDSEDDMSERFIPDVARELEKYPVIKGNYSIESLGRTLRMTKKEYESPDIELFRK
jgi:hypothetical protein